jgi:membrane protease YdiL (CAAX protease family)
MNHRLSSFFRWQPTKETVIAGAAGLIVIALSGVMIPTREIPWLNILIRDVLMIWLIGITFPLWYMRHSGSNFAQFGLTWRRWFIYLPINFILGIALFMLFLNEAPLPDNFHVTPALLWRIGYIMMVGIFEVLFFYSFQRTLFERAFGSVPAVLLASLFYTFHHIGFQPEYSKLFSVGIIYATTFRLGNSALMIYPFFWGVGGCYDVLVQSQVVSVILFPIERTLLLLVLIVTTVWRIRRKV